MANGSSTRTSSSFCARSRSRARFGGPDLVAPRPRLRIVPGKLSGAPHVRRTRIETEVLAALARRGLTRERIVGLYPVIEDADVRDALDLESDLQPALLLAA